MQKAFEKDERIALKKQTKVHRVLASSYSTYLVAVMLGFVLYLVYPIHFQNQSLEIVGFVFMMFGTLLIIWAQSSSDKSKKFRAQKESLSHHHFGVGPYQFLRSPTNVGLFMTLLGFGLVLSSLTIVLISLITFLITRFVFIEKQEKLLEEKYGEAYREYKKRTCVF